MSNMVAVLLGAVGITVIGFVLVLVYSSLEDADWWLKAFSIGLTGLLFIVGLATVVTGHYVGIKQKERADKAENALLELYKSLQPRRLTENFINHLKDKRPQVEVDVLHRPDENEPRNLAEGIVSRLRDLGWRTVDLSARSFNDEQAAVVLRDGTETRSVKSVPGVVVVVRGGQKPNQEAINASKALEQAFREDNIRVKNIMSNDVEGLFPPGPFGDNIVVIIVGQQIIELKPPQITITEDKQ